MIRDGVCKIDSNGKRIALSKRDGERKTEANGIGVGQHERSVYDE